MKKTKKPTALTKKAGSKQLQKKASPQPSMWAQLEQFIVNGEIGCIVIDYDAEHREPFGINFAPKNSEALPDGIYASGKSLEECAVNLAHTLNHSADASLKVVNAIKL